MPIKLVVSGQSPVTVSEEHIPIGSDPCCAIVFADVPEVKPIHAVIKEISGRWLVEACDTELLRVGNAEPGKRHWLKSGDVIRLTQNGPEITFDPRDEDDDFLPSIPKIVEEPPMPFFSDKKTAVTEEPLFQDTVDMATPTTSESLPTSNAPLSDTVSTTKSPLSDTVPAARAPKSGTIPAVKPPLSGTIATTRAPKSGTIPVSRSEAKAPPSGTIKSTASAKSSGSDSEIPARKPKRAASPPQTGADDEIDMKLPVLTRSSSWEDEELAPAPRRRGSSDKAEMDWIINVVIRCGIGGVGFLVLWMGVSMVWKALSQPGAEIPIASDPIAATNPLAPSNVVVAPPNPAPTRPVAKASVTKSPTNPAPSAEEKPADVKEADPKEDESPEMESRPDTVAMTEDPAQVKPAENESTNTPPEQNGDLSPLIQSTTESLYAVVMQDQAGQQIHLGTAWAVSDRHLVTSGTIGAKVNALLKKGYRAIGVQPSSDWSIGIKDARIHAKYVAATAAIASAIANNNDKLLAQEQVIQLRYNLAVLTVDPVHQLEKHLAISVRPFKTTTETMYSMVGFPLLDSGTKPSTTPNIGTLQECRSKRLSPTSTPRGKESVVNVKFAAQVTDRDWSGSPVLNKDDEVIGVYAEVPHTDAGKKDRLEQVVVWMGLLREVAPDTLKKVPNQIDDN